MDRQAGPYGYVNERLGMAAAPAADEDETKGAAPNDGRATGGLVSTDIIQEGTKVRLIDPPGSKVPYGSVGVAEGPPGSGGLFWVQFPQGRMHTRVSEVEVVQQGGEHGI